MLSDQVIQLLTAFVDGELSQRQRKTVMRVLQKSSEARDVLKQLQENAHKIKKLPRHKVEPSLVDEITRAIAEQQSQPKPAATPARRSAWLAYVAATMAASVLIGVIGLIVWQSMTNPQDVLKDGGQGLAKSDEKKIELSPAPAPERKSEQKAVPTPEPTPTPPQPLKKANPLLAKITEGTFRDFGATIVPFSASFADLKKNGRAIGQFESELNNIKVVELDVTVSKNSEALARLGNVLKNQGITLVTDSTAKKTVDKKLTEYLVYAENLTIDEVAKLMNELGDNYVVGLNNTQKEMPPPFQKATVKPLEQEAKKKITKLLGEPGAKKPETKSERMVIVLPNAASAQPSAEVRQFINQRRPSEPGTIQILIKIRQE